ncbi:MAG TPA: glycosyltransferase [Candidatus Dormibacteraeota bacterium]|nr:glycosyltransferase [Candidatus Dormibacteraeota bacterium]
MRASAYRRKSIRSVSVVVPVLNGAETIPRLLNGLMKQSRAPDDVEIIVVDGGSTDGTQKIVRNYNVKLFEERKPGPAAARNLGLKKARGDLVVFVDADMVPTKYWLSELVAVFANHDVIAATGRIKGFPPKTSAERFLAAIHSTPREEQLVRNLIPFVPSMNLAVRREHALRIGWRPEMVTGEDIDFCYRIQREFSTQIKYVPNAVTYHRRSRTDEDLRMIAWTQGEGLAHLFLRNPQLIPPTIVNSMRLVGDIGYRTLSPISIRKGNRLFGLKKADFSHYHKLWTRWTWRGIFSMLKNRAYKPLPSDH